MSNEDELRSSISILKRKHAVPQAEFERAGHRFAALAKGWAEQCGVTAQAFLAEGLPASLLVRAGFVVPTAVLLDAIDGTTEMSDDELRNALPTHRPFTVSGIAMRSGRSESAVQRAVRRAVEAGVIEPVAVSTMEGRSEGAILYQIR